MIYDSKNLDDPFFSKFKISMAEIFKIWKWKYIMAQHDACQKIFFLFFSKVIQDFFMCAKFQPLLMIFEGVIAVLISGLQIIGL